MIDAAQLAAAAKAFHEEEEHWRKLPRHHPQRPFISERHPLRRTEQRPFVKGSVVDPTFDEFADGTDAERNERIFRACLMKAIEAALSGKRGEAA